MMYLTVQVEKEVTEANILQIVFKAYTLAWKNTENVASGHHKTRDIQFQTNKLTKK